MELVKNPFLSQYTTPYHTAPFSLIKNGHYEPAFQKGIQEHNDEIRLIVDNTEPPTFKNTIEALERSGKLLEKVSNVFFSLMSAETNDEMMQISQKITPILTEHANSISLNEHLFVRIKKVYEQKDHIALDTEELKLLEDTYDGFIRKGADLQPEKKERYRILSAELSLLTLTFGQNILKESNQFELHLENSDDLEGIPEDIRVAAKLEAKRKGKEGWIFTLSMPSYLPFMKYASQRKLRETMYKAYSSRCAHGGEFDNRENIKQIINKRLEIAQLLGYKSYAEYILTKRMAKKSANVYDLLNELYEAYLPIAKEEVKELTEFAGKKDKGITLLMPWDWAYYAEQLKKEKYNLDDELLRPYFELERVKQGVFDLAAMLYGITFKRNKDIQVYHPDVEAYEVFDKDGSYLAVFYTDFHPRESKQNGAWMTGYQDQYMEGDVNIRPHVTIVMNFTKPTEKKPSLLTFDEFNTLLHEFGHALHGIFANTIYSSMSGTSVYRDFVELPSQIMENWATEKEYLNGFAKHYKTGENIPEQYIEQIKTASRFNVGYACLRQLSFGYIDMAWHTIETAYTEDIAVFEQNASSKTSLLPGIEGAVMSPAFSHIFSGGYAAGYYGYKWAEVLDADAFSLFQEKGIFNKNVATGFRHEILSKGGTEHPMILYKRFRGKEPDIKALLLRDNIQL